MATFIITIATANKHGGGTQLSRVRCHFVGGAFKYVGVSLNAAAILILHLLRHSLTEFERYLPSHLNTKPITWFLAQIFTLQFLPFLYFY